MKARRRQKKPCPEKGCENLMGMESLTCNDCRLKKQKKEFKFPFHRVDVPNVYVPYRQPKRFR
jgi:hypothetical protein